MNEQSPYGTFRARAVRLPRWQVAIFGALAATLVITLAVFATAVFLLVFPAMIVLDWIYRWRRRKQRNVAPSPPHETVITADYEVLPERDERR